LTLSAIASPGHDSPYSAGYQWSHPDSYLRSNC